MTSGARPDLEDRPDLIAQASAQDARAARRAGQAAHLPRDCPRSGEDLRDAAGRTRPAALRRRHRCRPLGAARPAGDRRPARRSRSASRPYGHLPGCELCGAGRHGCSGPSPGAGGGGRAAHANLPDERHAKRWQDIDDLLANGIDVYTTLNVANIESLGGAVSRITGVRRAEPVPDAFLRAGQVTLVDLAPRRCGAGWPRASLSRPSGWMRHCRAISASRTSPPCGSSRSSGLMTQFPIRSRRSRPPAASAGRCRPRSSWSATVADQVLRAAGDLPVQVVNVGRPDKTSHEWRRPGHGLGAIRPPGRES